MQPTKQRETHIVEPIPTAMKWQHKISHPTTYQPQPKNQLATVAKSNHLWISTKPPKPIKRKPSPTRPETNLH